MSNPGVAKKRLFVLLTQARMEGKITKRDWDLFKQIVEAGVNSVFSIKSNGLRTDTK